MITWKFPWHESHNISWLPKSYQKTRLHFLAKTSFYSKKRIYWCCLIYCCISIIEGYWVNDGLANWTCQPHEERRSQQSFSSTPGILSDLSRHTVTTPGKCLSLVQIYNGIILFYFTCLNVYWLFPTEIILSWGSLHGLFVWHKEYNDMHCTDLYNLPDRRKMLRT